MDERLIPPILAILLSPLLLGAIGRVKAFFAGRNGPPLLQPYRDLRKLLGKGAVYSRTTTAVFRAGPMVGLAALGAAACLIPLGRVPALLAFPGDFLLLAGLLALARFALVLAALDTGSSFEGMGASREAQFSALAEPGLFLALAALSRATGSLSLSEMASRITGDLWAADGLELGLVAAALGIVFLAENSRIPVDDPATHLELTMVHEVMVLDHGGPDLAFVLLARALKLWVLGALLAMLAPPLPAAAGWREPVLAAGLLLGIAVLVGLVESCMARLRLLRVPQLLVASAVLSALAILKGLA